MELGPTVSFHKQLRVRSLKICSSVYIKCVEYENQIDDDGNLFNSTNLNSDAETPEQIMYEHNILVEFSSVRSKRVSWDEETS